MGRKTGVKDQVVVKNSGGIAIEDTLGWIEFASVEVLNSTESKSGVGGGVAMQYNNDGVVELPGSLTIRPTSFEAFKLIGTASGGTVTLSETVPEHTFSLQLSETKYFKLEGFKFGKARIVLNKGEEPVIEFEGFGKIPSQVTGVLSTSLPSNSPFDYFDMVVEIGGTPVGVVSSATIEINYQLSSERGIESVAGDLRLPQEIIEHRRIITIEDLTIEVTDSLGMNEVLGGSSFADVRADQTLKIRDQANNNSITFSGYRTSDGVFELPNDDEVRTVQLSGTALDIISINYN